MPKSTRTNSATQPTDPASRLRAARRQCSIEALNSIVAEFRDRATTSDKAPDWHLLAEALLERVQQRTHLLGINVGKPMFDRLPAELTDDLDAGALAAARARELGDDSSEIHRIEAGLMSLRIIGFGTALKWNSKISSALKAAAKRDQQSANLHVALGLRKLLAPRWLGHDPRAALEHFDFATKAKDDERPCVFAAMACQLMEQRQTAIGWLERAAERNPHNGYARVVLARMRRGEENPFGRDVTAEEAAALK